MRVGAELLDAPSRSTVERRQPRAREARPPRTPRAGCRGRPGRRGRAAAAPGRAARGSRRTTTSSPSSRASTRFIAGVPMKAATKRLARLRGRAAAACRPAGSRPSRMHRDALAERHRLDLVVRDVDRRDAEPRVQLRERGAHLDAELRVEVRERLVHQERLRLAHDRAAHRDALALAARELRRACARAAPRGRAAPPPRRRGAASRPSACAAPSGRSRCSCARSCAGRARSSGRPSRCRGAAGRGR